MAKAALKQMTDLLPALKKAATTLQLSDDLVKQMNNVLDDSQKTLDGYKTDADGVTDAAGLADFQQKISKFQMDLRQQGVDILGQEDAQKLMQTARQSMRPGGAGGQPRRNTETAPTTAPAPN